VSFAVFWLLKALTKLNVRQHAAAAPTKSELLLGKIRDLLKTHPLGQPGDGSHPDPSKP
jgi:large-conductance mechanosensitive channel